MALLKFGELFSGAGGMSQGASQAEAVGPNGEAWRLVPAWAADSDGDACATYRLNVHGDDPKADVRCVDVRQMEASSLPHTDVLLFGFPCNDFSEVGRRRGMRGDYGPLYLEAIRVLRHHRPTAFIAENVGGLRSSHDGQALRQIMHDLSRSGYHVVPHLYRCEEYGVPQERRRIFLVGIRRGLRKRFHPPAPAGAVITAREALKPPVPPDTANIEPYPASPAVVERLKHIRPGENIWEAQRRADFPAPSKLNVKGAHLSLIYRRLDPDRPAHTVLSSGGGGTHGYHWDEPRPLTNRERARLQGFPDDFAFVGGMPSVRRQIGMAVPPPMGRAIAEALLNTLAGAAYPSVEPNIRLKPERLGRGRPRRLEAQTDKDRARDYRVRRVTEIRVAAGAIRRAMEMGLLAELGDEELALLSRFVERVLGADAGEMALTAAAE